MSKPDFLQWLYNEVKTAGLLLIRLIERRDNLLYIQAPALRGEYMEKVGTYEEKVLETELDAQLLRHKKELIQTALNRREPVDLDKINNQVEEERELRLEQLETSDAVSGKTKALNEEEMAEIQEIYSEIIKEYHPQVNPHITETEKELYEIALEAYKRNDYDTIKLVDEMLETAPAMELSFTPSTDSVGFEPEEIKDSIRELYENLATDYTLAAKLYPYYKTFEQDGVLKSILDRYINQRQDVEKDIDSIMNSFPFNARETLNNRAMLEDYIIDLRSRFLRGEEIKAEINREIEEMLKKVKNV